MIARPDPIFPFFFNPVGDQRYVTNRSNLIYSIMIQRGIVIPEYKEVTEDPGESSLYLPFSKTAPSY